MAEQGATSLLEGRVARFKDLKPIAIQSGPGIPQEALDIIYSRKLLPVIGLESGQTTALSTNAPISGAGGITMTFAFAPPNQGPQLHAHKRTFETFTVMKGTFEIRWGEKDDERIVLDEFDTISVPPGIYRAFKNVGDTDGWLQVIISGGQHDMNDVRIPKSVADELRQASPTLYERSETAGITFETS